MAIELCSENPNINILMSPRISFSHDLSQSDTVPVEQFLLRSISSSSTDFDFCINDKSDLCSSSADELFANGKILPTEIKVNKPIPTPIPPPSPQHETEKSKKTEESKKSFWRFKRSSSLNCGSGYARSLCPLPPLLRSNSTGSTQSSAKKSVSPSKEGVKVNGQKQGNGGGYHKPPLRKNGYINGGGVRVNPVLNVNSGNLFGLGSIFFSNRDKNKKR